MNVIHIGYPKAASTTIQFLMLAKSKSHLYISRKNNGAPEESEEIYNKLSSAISFGKDIKPARKVLEDFTQGRPYIFSDERITFPNARHSPASRVEVCRKIFGPAHLLIVLRNPMDQTRSLYQHWNMLRLKNKQIEPELSIDEWLGDDIRNSAYRPGDFSSALHFGEIANAGARAFGAENVTVCFFENIVKDFMPTLEYISERTGILYDTPEKEENLNSSDNYWVTQVRKCPKFDSTFSEARAAEIKDITRHNAEMLKRILSVDVPQSWLD